MLSTIEFLRNNATQVKLIVIYYYYKYRVLIENFQIKFPKTSLRTRLKEHNRAFYFYARYAYTLQFNCLTYLSGLTLIVVVPYGKI